VVAQTAARGRQSCRRADLPTGFSSLQLIQLKPA